MLQGEHSAILWTFIKLPFVIKIFVLSIFEWSFKTGFTVLLFLNLQSKKEEEGDDYGDYEEDFEVVLLLLLSS